MVTKINNFESQKKYYYKQAINKPHSPFNTLNIFRLSFKFGHTQKIKTPKKARPSQCSALFECLYSTVDFRFSFHSLALISAWSASFWS